jgi:hypothetical protein
MSEHETPERAQTQSSVAAAAFDVRTRAAKCIPRRQLAAQCCLCAICACVCVRARFACSVCVVCTCVRRVCRGVGPEFRKNCKRRKSLTVASPCGASSVQPPASLPHPPRPYHHVRRGPCVNSPPGSEVCLTLSLVVVCVCVGGCGAFALGRAKSFCGTAAKGTERPDALQQQPQQQQHASPPPRAACGAKQR